MPLVGIWRIQMSKNVFAASCIDNKHLTVSLSRSGADQGKRHRTFLFLYFNCFKRTKLALNYNNHHFTKMKFSIKDFFSKCDQMDSFLQIWSHLLKKFSNFIFRAVHIYKTNTGFIMIIEAILLQLFTVIVQVSSQNLA